MPATRCLSERVNFALTSRGLAPGQSEGTRMLSREGWGAKLFVADGYLSSGFVLPKLGIAVISADEMLGFRKRKKRSAGGLPLLNPFTQLNVGDAVVHQDNGIGIFQGVMRLELEGFKSDFVQLEYLGGDKLYVPVYRLSLLQRYIGDTDAFIIDKLGGTRWSKVTEKARESVAKLANDLLAIYAKRESSIGFTYDTSAPVVEEFEDTFPYEETEDQLKAVEEVYGDMASRKPMDRLICGDVGYGKTEVALRAAYAAVMSGKQVCVLVPTTLLARQHLNTFKDRFSNWPFRVEGISGFSTSAHNKEVQADLEKGKVDVIIGTHALLTERVKFRDLGLLIVDEEHRFGVKDKEKIKAKRAEVDILTLTATPIPRTLNMAISGIRDLSVIETPPVDRKSIETVVSRYDEETVQQVITRELLRGGQVFFVHNQVASIESMARRIEGLVANARVGVAHGQMSRTQLEHVMSRLPRPHRERARDFGHNLLGHRHPVRKHDHHQQGGQIRPCRPLPAPRQGGQVQDQGICAPAHPRSRPDHQRRQEEACRHQGIRIARRRVPDGPAGYGDPGCGRHPGQGPVGPCHGHRV